MQPLRIYALAYGFSYNEINAKQSEQKNSAYRANVQNLMDSAKYFYTKKQFRKTYDYYNTASTFLGGMSNLNNLEAAIIFAKIAAVNDDGQYKSISLDFLDLLFFRNCLSKAQLHNQPAFKVLKKERRWTDLSRKLN